MGRINVEIPEDDHKELRKESAVKNVPLKYIVQDAISNRYSETESEEAEEEAEDSEQEETADTEEQTQVSF